MVRSQRRKSCRTSENLRDSAERRTCQNSTCWSTNPLFLSSNHVRITCWLTCPCPNWCHLANCFCQLSCFLFWFCWQHRKRRFDVVCRLRRIWLTTQPIPLCNPSPRCQSLYLYKYSRSPHSILRDVRIFKQSVYKFTKWVYKQRLLARWHRNWRKPTSAKTQFWR